MSNLSQDNRVESYEYIPVHFSFTKYRPKTYEYKFEKWQGSTDSKKKQYETKISTKQLVSLNQFKLSFYEIKRILAEIDIEFYDKEIQFSINGIEYETIDGDKKIPIIELKEKEPSFHLKMDKSQQYIKFQQENANEKERSEHIMEEERKKKLAEQNNKIGILFIKEESKDQSNHLQSDLEIKEILNVFSKYKVEVNIKISTKFHEIKHYIQNYQIDIIHVACHMSDPNKVEKSKLTSPIMNQSSQSSEITLENEDNQWKNYSVSTFAQLFSKIKYQPNLIFLNSCYSEYCYEAITSQKESLNIIYINKLFGVEDSLAIKFITTFYNKLLSPSYQNRTIQQNIEDTQRELTFKMINKNKLIELKKDPQSEQQQKCSCLSSYFQEQSKENSQEDIEQQRILEVASKYLFYHNKDNTSCSFEFKGTPIAPLLKVNFKSYQQRVLQEAISKNFNSEQQLNQQLKLEQKLIHSLKLLYPYIFDYYRFQYSGSDKIKSCFQPGLPVISSGFIYNNLLINVTKNGIDNFNNLEVNQQKINNRLYIYYNKNFLKQKQYLGKLLRYHQESYQNISVVTYHQTQTCQKFDTLQIEDFIQSSLKVYKLIPDEKYKVEKLIQDEKLKNQKLISLDLEKMNEKLFYLVFSFTIISSKNLEIQEEGNKSKEEIESSQNLKIQDERTKLKERIEEIVSQQSLSNKYHISILINQRDDNVIDSTQQSQKQNDPKDLNSIWMDFKNDEQNNGSQSCEVILNSLLNILEKENGKDVRKQNISLLQMGYKCEDKFKQRITIFEKKLNCLFQENVTDKVLNQRKATKKFIKFIIDTQIILKPNLNEELAWFIQKLKQSRLSSLNRTGSEETSLIYNLTEIISLFHREKDKKLYYNLSKVQTDILQQLIMSLSNLFSNSVSSNGNKGFQVNYTVSSLISELMFIYLMDLQNKSVEYKNQYREEKMFTVINKWCVRDSIFSKKDSFEETNLQKTLQFIIAYRILQKAQYNKDSFNHCYLYYVYEQEENKIKLRKSFSSKTSRHPDQIQRSQSEQSELSNTMINEQTPYQKCLTYLMLVLQFEIAVNYFESKDQYMNQLSLRSLSLIELSQLTELNNKYSTDMIMGEDIIQHSCLYLLINTIFNRILQPSKDNNDMSLLFSLITQNDVPQCLYAVNKFRQNILRYINTLRKFKERISPSTGQSSNLKKPNSQNWINLINEQYTFVEIYYELYQEKIEKFCKSGENQIMNLPYFNLLKVVENFIDQHTSDKFNLIDSIRQRILFVHYYFTFDSVTRFNQTYDTCKQIGQMLRKNKIRATFDYSVFYEDSFSKINSNVSKILIIDGESKNSYKEFLQFQSKKDFQKIEKAKLESVQEISFNQIEDSIQLIFIFYHSDVYLKFFKSKYHVVYIDEKIGAVDNKDERYRLFSQFIELFLKLMGRNKVSIIGTTFLMALSELKKDKNKSQLKSIEKFQFIPKDSSTEITLLLQQSDDNSPLSVPLFEEQISSKIIATKLPELSQYLENRSWPAMGEEQFQVNKDSVESFKKYINKIFDIKNQEENQSSTQLQKYQEHHQNFESISVGQNVDTNQFDQNFNDYNQNQSIFDGPNEVNPEIINSDSSQTIRKQNSHRDGENQIQTMITRLITVQDTIYQKNMEKQIKVLKEMINNQSQYNSKVIQKAKKLKMIREKNLEIKKYQKVYDQIKKMKDETITQQGMQTFLEQIGDSFLSNLEPVQHSKQSNEQEDLSNDNGTSQVTGNEQEPNKISMSKKIIDFDHYQKEESNIVSSNRSDQNQLKPNDNQIHSNLPPLNMESQYSIREDAAIFVGVGDVEEDDDEEDQKEEQKEQEPQLDHGLSNTNGIIFDQD